MKVIRVVRDDKNPYVVINKTSLIDPNLSVKAKGFLAVIFSLPPTWDFSINGIAKTINESTKSVYKLIAELESQGYCKKGQNNTGRFGKVEYSFYEAPYDEDFIPLAQNSEAELITPLAQNAQAQKPLSGNGPQLSIKELSTNQINKLNEDEVKNTDFKNFNFNLDQASDYLKSKKQIQMDRLKIAHKLSSETLNFKIDEFLTKKFDWGENLKWINEDDMAKNFEFWLPKNLKVVINNYKSWTEEDFRNECKKYEKEFGTKLLYSFFHHYKQTDQYGNMEFQNQSSWNTLDQIKTWKARNSDFSNPKKTNNSIRNFKTAGKISGTTAILDGSINYQEFS